MKSLSRPEKGTCLSESMTGSHFAQLCLFIPVCIAASGEMEVNMDLSKMMTKFIDMPKASKILLRVGAWLFVLQLCAGLAVVLGNISIPGFDDTYQFAVLQGKNAIITLLECITGAMFMHLRAQKSK